ncbi:MAG: hypothetical protein ACOYJQ_07260 [Pseudochelatococcus sp.]|jgi:hypothetical protein
MHPFAGKLAAVNGETGSKRRSFLRHIAAPLPRMLASKADLRLALRLAQ